MAIFLTCRIVDTKSKFSNESLPLLEITFIVCNSQYCRRGSHINNFETADFLMLY